MNNEEALKKVVAMLFSGSFDQMKVLQRLAIEYPVIFVELSGVEDPRKEMDAKIDDFLFLKQKVEAIKYCRTITGWGLKEAKDYCDARGARSLTPTFVPTPKFAPFEGVEAMSMPIRVEKTAIDLDKLMDAISPGSLTEMLREEFDANKDSIKHGATW